jgi:hypothetical protein
MTNRSVAEAGWDSFLLRIALRPAVELVLRLILGRVGKGGDSPGRCLDQGTKVVRRTEVIIAAQAAEEATLAAAIDSLLVVADGDQLAHGV